MVYKLRSCSNTPSKQHDSAHRWHQHDHGDGHHHDDHHDEHDHHHDHHRRDHRGRAGVERNEQHRHGQRYEDIEHAHQLQTHEHDVTHDGQSSSRGQYFHRFDNERIVTKEIHSTTVSSSSSSMNQSSTSKYMQPELFDSLPKTDYTYAHTLTYNTRGPSEGYVSPNLSRRSIHENSDDSSDTSHAHASYRDISAVSQRSARHNVRYHQSSVTNNSHVLVTDSPSRTTTRAMAKNFSPNVSLLRNQSTSSTHTTSQRGNGQSDQYVDSRLDGSRVSAVRGQVSGRSSLNQTSMNANGGGADDRNHQTSSGKHKNNSVMKSIFGLDDDDADFSSISQTTALSTASRFSYISAQISAPAYEGFLRYIGPLYIIISQILFTDVRILLRSANRQSCWLLCVLLFLFPLVLLGLVPLLGTDSGYALFRLYNSQSTSTRSSTITSGAHEQQQVSPSMVAAMEAMLEARLADVARRLALDSSMTSQFEALIDSKMAERASANERHMDAHVQELVSRLFMDKWRESEASRPATTTSTTTLVKESGLKKADVLAIVRDVIREEQAWFNRVKDELTTDAKLQVQNMERKSQVQQQLLSSMELKLKTVADNAHQNSEKFIKLSAMFDSFNSTVTHDTIQMLVRQSLMEEMTSHEHVTNQHFHSNSLSEEELTMIRGLLIEMMPVAKADGTDKPDYALESGGGSVITTRCTETYRVNTAMISLFGIPLYYQYNSPRMVIQPDVQIGNCWPFQGEGTIVIKLSGTIIPTDFTMEHIPKSISPTGDIDSAPNRFTVWGLQDDNDESGWLLGNYTYDSAGPSLQTYHAQDVSHKPTLYIELKVHTNHGHSVYTCLYRFRVHGKLVQF